MPASAIESDNLDGRIAFDDTVDKSDVNALVQISFVLYYDRLMYPRVRQYLSGTGNRGGPLVTTANKTVQSDLRLFESDQNATIKEYFISFPNMQLTNTVCQSSPVTCSLCFLVRKPDIADDKRKCQRLSYHLSC